MPLRPSIYGTGEMVPVRYGGNDIETLGAAGSWLATAPDLMRLLLAVDGFNYNEDPAESESIRFMTDINNNYAPVGWKTTYHRRNMDQDRFICRNCRNDEKTARRDIMGCSSEFKRMERS